jgi:hypothetical protein
VDEAPVPNAGSTEAFSRFTGRKHVEEKKREREAVGRRPALLEATLLKQKSIQSIDQ